MTGLLLPLTSACVEEGLTNPPAPTPAPTDTAEVIPGPPDYQDGEELFSTACTSCHGEDGDSGSAPNLSVFVPAFDDEELFQIIENGTSSMPGNLVATEDIPVLISYLRETFP